MTAEKLQEFIPNLLSKLYIEALIYGNVTKQVKETKEKYMYFILIFLGNIQSFKLLLQSFK